jgi:hypothetical protein
MAYEPGSKKDGMSDLPPDVQARLKTLPVAKCKELMESVEDMSCLIVSVLNAATYKFGPSRYGAQNFPAVTGGNPSPLPAAEAATAAERLLSLVDEAVVEFQQDYKRLTGKEVGPGDVMRACIAQHKMGFFSKYSREMRAAWDRVVAGPLLQGKSPDENHILCQINREVMFGDRPTRVPDIFERSGVPAAEAE